LLPNYMSVAEYNNQNNAESIFELQFQNPAGGKEDWNSNGNGGPGTNEVTWMSSFGMPWEITSLGYTFANKKLYDSFEPGDTRKLATVIGPDDINPSPGIIAIGGIASYPNVISGFAGHQSLPAAHYTGTDGKVINTIGKASDPWIGNDLSQVRSGYYGMKTWRDPNVTGATTSPVDGIQHIFGDQNVTLLRYGEVLLSKAEAQFKAGDLGGATASLQRVRNRAWNGTAPVSAYGPDFMQIMLQEYRHELGGEMSVWYNMRRTGLQIAYIKNTFGITIPPGHDLLPLPQQALDSNPTLVQNPNY